MAKKICSLKETCVHGNVPQDYDNFYKNRNRYDQHQSECKDCLKRRRDQNNKKNSGNYFERFDMFIG